MESRSGKVRMSVPRKGGQNQPVLLRFSAQTSTLHVSKWNIRGDDSFAGIR